MEIHIDVCDAVDITRQELIYQMANRKREEIEFHPTWEKGEWFWRRNILAVTA